MISHVFLNLGAGVQSSAIYSLIVDGELPPVEAAIFADTGEEPAWVYRQLDWLRSLDGPPIITTSIGRLGDHLIHGINSTGQRFASIPTHTTYIEGQPGGQTRRQCTREYKIRPIEQWVRREFLGLKPRQRVPKDVQLIHWFGFSTDEPGRAARSRLRFKQVYWGDVDFPLLWDRIWMSRVECERYIRAKSGFQWRSSRCTFCPYQGNKHWRELKKHDPEGWRRACEIDAAMRTTGAIANRDMNEKPYVHRSCRPLVEANLDEAQLELFEIECEGGCST